MLCKNANQEINIRENAGADRGIGDKERATIRGSFGGIPRVEPPPPKYLNL
jgi:hypothetical protein